MEREKVPRKKSFDRGRELIVQEDLPKPPPDPTIPIMETIPSAPVPTIVIESQHPSPKQQPSLHRKESDPFTRIASYKDREAVFLQELNETYKKTKQVEPSLTPRRDSSYNDDSGLGNKGSDYWDSDDTEGLDAQMKECDEFINPLLNRANASISVALSTKGALDQLDSLHKLVHQFLNLQEQNLNMKRTTDSLNMIYGLKIMRNQASIYFKQAHLLFYRRIELKVDL